MKRYGLMRLLAAGLLTAVLAAGCAALSPTANREMLEERVKSYMRAQIDRKWESVYSHFDSSTRAKVAREAYLKRTPNLSFRGFTIDEITVLSSGDKATVKVAIDIAFMGHTFKGAPQKQEWVKENGEWFVKAEPQSRKTPFDPKEKGK